MSGQNQPASNLKKLLFLLIRPIYFTFFENLRIDFHIFYIYES